MHSRSGFVVDLVVVEVVFVRFLSNNGGGSRSSGVGSRNTIAVSSDSGGGGSGVTSDSSNGGGSSVGGNRDVVDSVDGGGVSGDHGLGGVSLNSGVVDVGGLDDLKREKGVGESLLPKIFYKLTSWTGWTL